MNGKFTFAALALSIALIGPTGAFAQSHGGGHGGGGGHSSGGGGNHSVTAGHSSGHFSGYHGAPGGVHGYAHIGARPYYGGYGHSYGRPYYRSSYFYPRHRFYGGLGLGLFVASLPLYYDTFWWGGLPYYYNDGTYYLYNDHVRKYEVVAPPYSEEAGSAADGNATQSANDQLFVYPKDGQSEEQQKSDRFECHQWAANQSGFDPSNGAAAAPDKQLDYRRAETACLTGRGYSVK